MEKVCMTRKCHNHTLQINLRHNEEGTEEYQPHYIKRVTSSLFPNEMIAKVERSLKK